MPVLFANHAAALGGAAGRHARDNGRIGMWIPSFRLGQFFPEPGRCEIVTLSRLWRMRRVQSQPKNRCKWFRASCIWWFHPSSYRFQTSRTNNLTNTQFASIWSWPDCHEWAQGWPSYRCSSTLQSALQLLQWGCSAFYLNTKIITTPALTAVFKRTSHWKVQCHKDKYSTGSQLANVGRTDNGWQISWQVLVLDGTSWS